MGSGETTLRPAERSTVHIEQGVFLLDTEPRLEVLSLLHDLLRVVTIVRPVRGAIVVVALREDEDVVTATERVFEDGSGTEIDVRIVTRSLVGGRTIEIPYPKLLNACNLLGYSLIGVRQSVFRRSAAFSGDRHRDALRKSVRRFRALTVVLERNPPSPSIQTSIVRRPGSVQALKRRTWGSTDTQPGSSRPEEEQGRGQAGRGGTE